MSGVYRLENALSNRAGCSNKECKENKVKIDKGTLRFGSQYTVQDHQAWSWRHWGCVTPAQISNLKEAIEDNLEYLDGFEDIDEDMQEKVMKALEDGHVADEDWKGDVERNRPGKKGFRTPVSVKKAAKKEAQDEDGDESPSQTAAKKRRRVKKEDDDHEEEPASKKTKANSKKGKKRSAEVQNENFENQAPSPKKATAKGKKVVVKAETDDYCDQSDGDKESLPHEDKKKTRAPRKATLSKKIKDEGSETEGDEEVSAESLKSKPSRKKARTITSAKGTDEATDAISISKVKDEVNETAEDNETPVEDPKVKPGRKRGVAKGVVNDVGKASKVKKGNEGDTTTEFKTGDETTVTRKNPGRSVRSKKVVN